MLAPVPILLWCPLCGARHIDEGEFATKSHHTHSCQECGLTWRPAVVPTVGVRFLPGFKNEIKTILVGDRVEVRRKHVIDEAFDWIPGTISDLREENGLKGFGVNARDGSRASVCLEDEGKTWRRVPE